mmetsp:Transcript_81757/g.212702  ORF Transcript_81757/g.212702 Transcript_81757/m.212702 type:complete len:476 (+) Transcript_81757:89-1516(+)
MTHHLVLSPFSQVLLVVALVSSAVVVSGLTSLPSHAQLVLQEASSERSCDSVADVDPAELAMLAGDAMVDRNLTDEAMASIGWVRGTRAGSGRFTAYEKGCHGGLCDYCAIGFSAGGDDGALAAVGDLSPASFCGADGVRGGYVKHMRSFFEEPAFAQVAKALSPSRCCRVYATGQSMGTSMAAMYAFCANQRQATPGADKAAFAGVADDISLVTFAEDRLSETPLYNGAPGQCFDGARYVIWDAKADAPAYDSREVQMDGLEVVSETMRLMGSPEEAASTQGSVAKLRALAAADEAAEWQRVFDEALQEAKPFMSRVGDMVMLQAVALAPVEIALGGGHVPTKAFSSPAELWLNHTLSYRASYEFNFDLVPGLHPQLKFPDMRYVPIQHSSVGGPAPQVPDPSTCNTAAPSLPDYNMLQYYFGGINYRLGRSMHAPSHEVCCYIQALQPNISAADCGARYYDNAKITCPPAWGE